MSFLSKRMKSFGYAFKGIRSFICKEPNAWIHCMAVVVVVVAGIYFDITVTEWCLCVLCFGLVLMAEAMNTAIERLVNLVSPQRNPIAGDVKDVAAGGVLLAALSAAVIGLIVFIPYLFA